jgi:Secretion system C-terminal sorting domain
MKKIYTLVIAVMAAFVMNAQVNVTFQVDMSDYLNLAGNTLKTIKIAGAFPALNATAKGVAVPEWKPEESPVFTKVVGSKNTWQTVITFPNPAKGQDLFFKFLNTNDKWGNCNIEQECMDVSATACSNQPTNDNRLIKIPTTSKTIGYKWGTCTSITSAKELALEEEVTITPNPAKDLATLTIKGTANYNVAVTTVAGQLVQNFENVTSNVAIEGLNTGMYFVTVRNAEGKFSTQKLIIE